VTVERAATVSEQAEAGERIEKRGQEVRKVSGASVGANQHLHRWKRRRRRSM